MSDDTIPALLRRQAAHLTLKPFMQVWQPGEGVVLTLSFAEMLRRVEAAERELLGLGVTHGQRVAMLSHPTAAFFVYALALAGLGAISVNLNWRMPPPAILATVEVAEATLLVSSARLADAARFLRAHRPAMPVAWLDRPASGTDAADRVLRALDGAAIVPDASSAPVPAYIRRPEANDVAAIMFTSGSTATPKAVPLTHRGLLWNCRQRLALQAEAFAEPNAGTLSLLPNFHVIGFTNNFLFNLLAGVRCVVQADAGGAALSARLMLEACACTRPTVLDTVPWLVEELIRILESGDAEAGCLRRLQFILAGGCALNEELLLPALRRHGVTLWPHYGQTELGGPALVGGLAGNLAAMRPLPGVKYELEGGEDDEEGELVLIGMHSATAGYLPGSNGRRLQGSSAATTAQRFYTGDVFRRLRAADGSEWLVHACRQDDLLVHTTGEMTNPLPIEAALYAKCADVVHALCLVGQQQPRPFLVVELKPDAERAKATAALAPHLAAVNATQPGYSAIAAAAVIFADEALPKSAKGNVVRSLVEKKYRPQMVELQAPAADDGDDDDSDGDGGEEEAADSIALVASKRRPKKARPLSTAAAARAARAHMYFFAMLHVLLHHNEVLYGGGPLCSSSPACNPVASAVHDLFYPVAMPSFLLLAGLKDAAAGGASPGRLLRQIVVLVGVGSFFFYAVPDLAHRFWHGAMELELRRWSRSPPDGAAAKVGARLGATLIHVHTYQWFFFVLAAYKLVAVARGCFLGGYSPRAIAAVALLLHFLSFADAPWPLMRNPVNYRPQSNPMYEAEASFRLPVMAKFAPLWPFYAALPLLLPANFPVELPFQRRCATRGAKVAVRIVWAALFLALALAQPVLPDGHLLSLKADASPMMVAYGCKEAYFRPYNAASCVGGRPAWTLAAFGHDALHLVLTSAAAVGFGACMPQMPTALSAAGDETLFCYLLHVPLTPAIQSAFAVGLLEAASADARSPRRGAVALLYMLAVQIALSRKPRVALPRWPRWR